jgi:putative ATPase
MSQAAIYLAVAPKSNSALTTYAAAKRDVEEFGALPVPMHLRNASSALGKSLGFAQGYQYPHNTDGHYVVENYLPESLRDRRYYEPSKSGRERDIGEYLDGLRKREK